MLDSEEWIVSYDKDKLDIEKKEFRKRNSFFLAAITAHS